MGLSYSHLLIPVDDKFRPTGEMIAEFLKGAIALGVVPGAKLAFYGVNRVRPQVARSRNPFTGETLILRGPSRLPRRSKALRSTKQIASVAKGVREFNVQAFGFGSPRTPPVRIDFSRPYSIAVITCVRSRPVSLSDLHEESSSKR